MQLLLIKIGKALKTLRRDGIFKGGKRVTTAFFALFRFVGKGDILFVTGGVGDSARYRCHHVSEELELNGIHCAITVQDNPLLPKYADNFKVVIFHRVLFTPSVAKLIDRIKQQGKEIIFETDDLVYDPKFLQFMDYFKQMNVFERKLYENGVGGEILKDPYVKVCTTTTTYLAEKLKENDKQVFIVPNKLCKHDLEVADKILEAKKENENKEIKIGYFSGNLSHNKDFATINDALMQLMEKYSQVQLYLAGPLDLENKLSKFSDRIGQFPYVERDKHFANVASVDINVAPLEIGNPFCESKSELKFFEAGIVKVPTVAAATAPFMEAIEDGVDGFVANGTQQWFEKLEKLVIDSELRKSMGEKARAKALEKYATSNANNEQYYAYLKSKINF
jgi:glycosyltransferase involved in cell wall biosynthesis